MWNTASEGAREMAVPRIALTPGEPAGIGPDLCVRIAQQTHAAELVAIADPALLAERARLLGLPLHLEPLDLRRPPRPQAPATLTVEAVPCAVPPEPGWLCEANAPYVLDTLRRAVRGCLAGEFDALVTGPVHKGVLNDAGIPFTGHTEFLAAESQCPQVVMMLATPGLRVALVTTHLPLRQVCEAITPDTLAAVLRITHRALHQDFGLSHPHLLVCGLNPHAGEGGHLGREELEIIIPTLERLRAEGLALEGPLPADTVFVPERLARADAVVAMYHDQGLAVLKHMGFGRAVNVTLGLPFIRTSVDHGTALELAGRPAEPRHGPGQDTGPSTGSLAYALETARVMIEARIRNQTGSNSAKEAEEETAGTAGA